MRTWEKTEIRLVADRQYDNPYMDVDVWVDLKGPGFEKRVYGFWDGGSEFVVRVVATAPGRWTWTSGSSIADSGLSGQSGSLDAEDWSESEKQKNPCRRGFLRASQSGHALDYADGTPCFLLGDTWWATPSYRFRWYDDDEERPVGPEMGFKDYVRYRRAQGYNLIAMIAGHPTWARDGKPPRIVMDDGIALRQAWEQPGEGTARDMHNEGGRPFEFPGPIPGYEDVFPDVTRINPAYFKAMDRKIDYLNSQGFIPFIEVARRDISTSWKKYGGWPDTYARYIQYIFCRYQANNCILSPIHFDWDAVSIPAREFNEPIMQVVERYGMPPFGTLVSSNAQLSNLRNFGNKDEAPWLTLYQIGNWSRCHCDYEYLTEIFEKVDVPSPALNGEPYYSGGPHGWPRGVPPADNEEDELYCRSGMYGSVLSGGLAGHIYGARELWAATISDAADTKMWDSLQWRSGDQMRFLRQFIMAKGSLYQRLIPRPSYINPSRTGDHMSYKGWAYCAGTPEDDVFFLYFEKESVQVTFNCERPGARYKATWFDPRTGEWIEHREELVPHLNTLTLKLPEPPTNNDWAMILEQL